MVAMCVVLARVALACDVCGCSIGQGQMGVMPQWRSHFVALRYQSLRFRTQHPSHDGTGQGTLSDDYFQSVELWGRWAVSRRVLLTGSLPYRVNALREPGAETLHFSHFGDASATANVILFQSKDTARVRHVVQVSAGLKAPTGHFRGSEDVAAPVNMLPGTGSWDVPVGVVYTLRRLDWVFQGELNARWNSTNPDQYRFGNRVAGTFSAFRWWQKGRTSWLPGVGLTAELQDMDRRKGAWVTTTGGAACLAQAGLDVFHRSLGFGLNAQIPVWSDLGGGIIQALPRLNARVLFFF